VSDKTGIPKQEMRLVFAGKEIDLTKPALTLQDYAIQNGSTLMLCMRLL
jgi:hypothetical protein